MILFVASAIVGGIVGVAVGTIIHIHKEVDDMVTTYIPTPVTMPDGSKRYLFGGGQLLFKAEAEKEKEAGD